MICNNCGKETLDNTKFCMHCGSIINKEEDSVIEFPEMPVNSTEDNGISNVVPERDVNIKLLGHDIKGRLIMKIAAIIATVCFFCPMFMVSCSGVEVKEFSLSGVMLGSVDEEEETYDDMYYDTNDEDSTQTRKVWAMIIYLLIPLSAFGTCMVNKAEKGWGQMAANTFGTGALSILLLYRFVWSEVFTSEYAQYGAEIKPMAAFYIYLISCIIGMCVGIIVAKKHSDEVLLETGEKKSLKNNVLWKTLLGSLGGTLAMLVVYYILNEGTFNIYL